MESWLRHYDPPIIARVEKERLFLDVRTIEGRKLKTVAAAIRELDTIEVTKKGGRL
jgi:hypothetical protein